MRVANDMRQSWKATVLGMLIAAALSVNTIHAQCKPSDFPGPGKLVASPTRPLQTSSPDPVQTGVVQVEAGFGHSWRPDASSQDSVTSLVKLGLWCNTEIRWSTASITSVKSGNQRVTGTGDLYFGSQYRLVRETSRWPSLAVSYSLKTPTAKANEGLGSGRSDHAFSLLVGRNTHGFSAVFNTSYFSIGQPEGGRDGKMEWTLSVAHPVKGKWGITGEVFGDSELNAANAAYASSTWAVTYSRSPRLVLDVGSSASFTSGPGAPGNGAFAGVTYVLGDLYGLRRK